MSMMACQCRGACITWRIQRYDCVSRHVIQGFLTDLQSQANLNGVMEGRLLRLWLEALVQAGQQRGASLSLPLGLQSSEHLQDAAFAR